MKLEDLNIYQMSMTLADEVWNIVMKWENFEKFSIGKQLVNSIDSVSANISEGFGRFHYKDAKNFYYFARGSLYESKTWITKASNRNLIDKEISDRLLKRFE
jgi:four helix bundle protein